jgi:hypothetical protein
MTTASFEPSPPKNGVPAPHSSLTLDASAAQRRVNHARGHAVACDLPPMVLGAHVRHGRTSRETSSPATEHQERLIDEVAGVGGPTRHRAD